MPYSNSRIPTRLTSAYTDIPVLRIACVALSYKEFDTACGTELSRMIDRTDRTFYRNFNGSFSEQPRCIPLDWRVEYVYVDTQEKLRGRKFEQLIIFEHINGDNEVQNERRAIINKIRKHLVDYSHVPKEYRELIIKW